jgi:hypothetical protein
MNIDPFEAFESIEINNLVKLNKTDESKKSL